MCRCEGVFVWAGVRRLCIGNMLACVMKYINSTLYRVPRFVSVCTNVAL